MSLFRAVLLVILISFTAAAGLFYFGSMTGHEEFRGGYAVLTIPSSADEDAVLSMLNLESAPVSESSQWVYLDEFDSVNKIPLNQFYEKIFDFDPRNDGYAQKLTDLFLNDDKRFIYLPLNAGNRSVDQLDQTLNEILGGIPFTVDYFGVGSPLYLFFLSYAASAFLLFIICLITLKRKNGMGSIIALIPVLASFAFFGAHGIAICAVFFALYILINDLRNDMKIQSGFSRRKKQNAFIRFLKEKIIPYRFYYLFMLLFPAAFAVLIYFSHINILFFAAEAAVSLIVFCVSLKLFSLPKRAHKRFAPVPIKRQNNQMFSFPVYILPFAAAAVFIIFASPYTAASYESSKRFDTIITEENYIDHIKHQHFFSERRIGGSNTNLLSAPEFFYDTDGLPLMSNDKYQSINISDYPPFPLRHLMDFFEDVNSGNKTTAAVPSDGIAVKLSLLILLIFIIPLFFTKKKNVQSAKILKKKQQKQHTGSTGEKIRFKGINRNKKTMYNKNIDNMQKDA